MGISFFINPAVYGSGGSGLPVIGSTLTHHYKTDGGITKDGSNRISQWDDMSGNGNHLVQATGSNQPLHNSSNQLNGYDAITMAGDYTFAEYFTQANTLNYNSTIFVVGKVEYDGGPHDNYDLIASNNGNNGTKFLLFQALNAPAGRSQSRDRSQVSGEHNVLSPSTSVSKNSTFYIMHNINPPSSSVVRINGVTQAISETGTNYITSAPDWILGKNSTNNIGYDGDIWEIIIYDGNVTGDDITTIETYIKDKYAL